MMLAEEQIAPRRTKICSQCKKELPISAFHRRANHVRKGVRAACKVCTAAQAKAARDQKQVTKTDDERLRAAVRQRTRTAIKRGDLTPQPCEKCGSPNVEAHHPRYEGDDAHLEVMWLCRHHHALEHGKSDWTHQLELIPRHSD